jgi:DNA polymerase-3 subunit epsilon
MQLAERILFVDVETTGFFGEDRVVSLGAIELGTVNMPEYALRFGQFIFNPGIPSHPKARKVHGYSDYVLSCQETFEEAMPNFRPLFDGANFIVAHNADFDSRFICREFRMAGAPLRDDVRWLCTMEECRDLFGRGKASLGAVIKRMGVKRSLDHHNALEDAWLALLVWLWLRNLPMVPPDFLPCGGPPNNWKEPPRFRGRLRQLFKTGAAHQ